MEFINEDLKSYIPFESLNKGNVEYFEADGALAFLEGYTSKDRKFFLKKV